MIFFPCFLFMRYIVVVVMTEESCETSFYLTFSDFYGYFLKSLALKCSFQ